MISRRSTGLLATAVLAGFALQATPAEDEPQQMQDVVVTATLAGTPASQLGQSVTVIGRKEIEASKLTYVSQLLQRVAGVDFNSYGPTSNPTIRIRGMQGYHTKVLIDGVSYEDASSIGGTLPVLNELRTDDIERIEIVRGASSTVHGSNAIGGVINIITRKGKDEGKPVAGSISAEYGSNQRQRYAGSLRGASGPVDYSLSAAWVGENGISSLHTDEAINGDDDAYRNAAYNGRVGLDLSENLRLEVFGRFADGTEEYDSGFSAYDYSTVPAHYLGIVPDSGDVHVQNWLVGTKLAATGLFDGLLDSSITLSYTQTRRSYRDEVDPFVLGPESTGFKDRYTGGVFEAKWLNTAHLAEGYDFSFGVDNTQEMAEMVDGGTVRIDERHRTWAYFGELQAEPIENLFLTAGARCNKHSVFGEETTWSASARYLIEASGTTLKAAAGKAYRAPSLYELYAPAIVSWYFKGGNPNLSPETSQSWEVGFEQSLLEDKVVFGSTYYETRIADYIGYAYDFDSFATYLQLSGIKAHGIESFVRVQPWDCLSVQLTHTYQHTNDMEDDHAPVAYRPTHKGSVDIIYQGLGDRLTVDLNGTYVGSRHTTNGMSWDQKLGSYYLMNLTVSYSLTEDLEIYGRIENLLDDGYETVPNYNTYGRCYYAGLKYTF